MLVGQHAKRRLGQGEGHPEETNLADDRKLAYLLWREQAQHEQRKRDLRSKC
jgi:hypothetical protein